MHTSPDISGDVILLYILAVIMFLAAAAGFTVGMRSTPRTRVPIIGGSVMAFFGLMALGSALYFQQFVS